MNVKTKRFIPVVLMAVIILIDQLVKAYIVQNVALYENFGEKFFNITHIKNPAAGFSLGLNWPEPWKTIMLIVVPLVALALGTVLLFKDRQFSFVARMGFASILGGGFGNIIDRMFRADGVVDMFDVTFFGIFGWERWPTFNVADVAIVVGAIVLIITLLMVREEKLYE